MNILILGAGGHGQTLLDALLKAQRQGGPMRPLGFLDDTPELQGRALDGLPVLGPFARLDDLRPDGVILGIGDNATRKALYLQLRARGLNLVTLVHPSAVVALNVTLGRGSYIGANATVGVATRIGENAIVSGSSCIGHHNFIGDHAHVGPGVHSTRDVQVGEGTLVGVGTNLVSGCKVGNWSVVMAGALVSREIPDNVLAGGTPARPIRSLAATRDRL